MTEATGERIVVALITCILVPLILFLMSEGAAKLIDFLHPPASGSLPLSVFSARKKKVSRRKWRFATRLYKEGKFDEASTLFADMLSRFEAAGSAPGTASAGFMLGYCAQRLGRNEEAIKAYKRATAMPPPEPIDVWLLALRSLSYCQAKLEDFSAAIETFIRLSQICKEKGKHDESVKALATLANTLVHRGRVDEASAWFAKALELSQECGVEGRRAVLHDYSLLLHLMGRTRESVRYLREAVELLSRSADLSVQAHMHSSLSYFLRAVGDIQEADKISQKAIELSTQSGAVPASLYALHSRAILEWARGNRDKTFELLDRAETMPQMQEDPLVLRNRRVLLLLTRAWYKEEIGEFGEALALVDKAEPLIGDLALELAAELWRTRTLALAKSGQWSQARLLLSSDSRFVAARTIPYHNAQYEQALGVIAFGAKEYPAAVASLGRAWEFFETAGQVRDAAIASKHLAIVCRGMGDHALADEYRQKSVAIFVAMGDAVSAGEVAKL
ncbi:MAG TPA: tetratricopeptide repeat protein [Candidatus Angelobacter sp.]